MQIGSVNPATGILLRSYEALTAEAVTSKIDTAHRGFLEYRKTQMEQRLLWIKKLAGILEQEMEELATLLTTETGRTITSSRDEVLRCATYCRYYAASVSKMLEEEAASSAQTNKAAEWQPMGVLLAVMPWTSGFWQAFRFLVPALLGGNVALLKHANNVPQSAVELELLVRRAGFPRGTFQTLLMEEAHLEAVLSDDRVVGVTFIGSKSAGRGLAAQAGWLMKKIVLETASGESFLVMPSANLFAAIQAGVRSRCRDNGQSSLATARFYVHEGVYSEFETMFALAMEDVKVGRPGKDETEMGPLATEQVVLELEQNIAAAVEAGIRLVAGGRRMLGRGNFFEPTVLAADASSGKTAWQGEMVGPVALLIKVTSAHEAIALMQHGPDGHSVSVWTQDKDEQARLGTQLECGNVFMNMAVVNDLRAPVGPKQWGHSRTLAGAGLREFMTPKMVTTAAANCEDEVDLERLLKDLDVYAPMETEIDDDGLFGNTSQETEMFQPAEDTFVRSVKKMEPHEVSAATALLPVEAVAPLSELELPQEEAEESKDGGNFNSMFKRALQVRT